MMMKINTKNLGMFVLLSVLMIGIIFVSGCTQKQNTSESNSATTGIGGLGGTSLPVYPNSQETNQYATWATMIGFSGQYAELHQYIVSGVSSSDVIKWYKSQFPDYTVENEGSASAQGVNYALLTLKKGNTIVGVAAFEQGKDTVYFVGRSIASEEEGESLPSHDMASG